jgi:hypothetical protein
MDVWEALQSCPSLAKMQPTVNSLKIRDWYEGWKGSLLESSKDTLGRIIGSSSYISDTVMKRYVEGVLDFDGANEEIVGALEDDGAWLNLGDFEEVRREIIRDALGRAKDRKNLK